MIKSTLNAARRPVVISSVARNLMLFCLLLSAFTGCDCLDCNQKSTFEVVPNLLLFENEGQQRTFTVTSSMNWRLVDMPAGYHFDVMVGKPGITMVTVKLTDTDVEESVTLWAQASSGIKKPVKLLFTAPNVVENTTIPIEPGLFPTGITPYVGAFWKADETGERIIRFYNMNAHPANQGAWSVSVIYLDPRWEKEDRVILSTNLSGLNANVWSSGDPGNAEDYPVTGSAITIKGKIDAETPDLIFRIGIKRPFTAPVYDSEEPDFDNTFPARYALLEIIYGTPAKKCLLFLRQGEGADYLMRPWDVMEGEARSAAGRISPYNLTATTFNTTLAKRGGIFTPFPTQAGAFFQWGATGTFMRYAFDAYNTNVPITWNPWAVAPNFWASGTNADDHETCPEHYRRITDGPVNAASSGAVSGSEIRQSLWANPKPEVSFDLSNSVIGYYADGFFDRREIVDASGGGTKGVKSTVSPTNKDIAHVGVLFYNMNNFASLFFPYNGWRADGSLDRSGAEGYYWLSSAYSASSIWRLHLMPWGHGLNYSSKGGGFGIRCARETKI